jgi:hypothetical protein
MVLLAGVLIAIVGECISAAGAPEIGVVDGWGRVDEAVSQIATWQYLLVVVAAFVLLGGSGADRFGTDAPSRRAVWWGVVIELTALAAAAVVGMVAVFERTSDANEVGGVGFSDYYSQTEKIGETVVYSAIVLVAAALLVLVVRETKTRTP